ncbi:hypothetical protein B296_00050889 [Ensete ventricosum]|uniref:Uncharacterized protein n=1 Tax=Ensete ventricosum TaxID=4639 RepID=A0A426WZJ2_ENSVE|nr:hypothetical protein B296_00050889 [Ensete ventricosum]
MGRVVGPLAMRLQGAAARGKAVRAPPHGQGYRPPVGATTRGQQCPPTGKGSRHLHRGGDDRQKGRVYGF